MQKSTLQTIVTRDGSPTLYRSDIDENYHSTFGAIAESEHVYIKSGLLYRCRCMHPEQTLKVFEVGLGTGLNALLSAATLLPLSYTAVEKFPIPSEVLSDIDYSGVDNAGVFRLIHDSQWNQPTQLAPTFEFTKVLADMTEYEDAAKYDVIYMDAFAPEKQPEMWTPELIGRLAAMLAPGGVLTTYCAKGVIRRTFESFGLESERLAGPPGGKREILRLTRPI